MKQSSGWIFLRNFTLNSVKSPANKYWFPIYQRKIYIVEQCFEQRELIAPQWTLLVEKVSRTLIPEGCAKIQFRCPVVQYKSRFSSRAAQPREPYSSPLTLVEMFVSYSLMSE